MSENISKQGFLSKLGAKGFKAWQKRYFTLVGKQLSYKKQKEDPDSTKKTINLNKVDYVAPAPEAKKPYAFKLWIKNERLLYLQADSANELNSWVETIEKWIRTDDADIDSRDVQIDDFTVEDTIFSNDGYTISQVNKKSNKKTFLLKKYEKNRFKSDELDSTISKQREFLQAMNPFVNSLRYLISNDDEICLYFDYIHDDPLFKILEEKGKFTESLTAFYASQMLLAIAYLHQHNVNYGFLKPQNVMIDEGFIKICPSGIKAIFSIGNEINDLLYIAPELLEPEIKSNIFGSPRKEADFYTFGCLIYEMLCGMPPFFNIDYQELEKMIQEGAIYYPYHISKEASSLINKLMNKNPSQRLTNIETIKADPFFKNVDWDKVTTKQCNPETIQ